MTDQPSARPARPGAAFVRSTVIVDGYEIGVLRGGSGPALVICPSSAGSEPSWAKDLLSEHFDVIELNPPGWGGTPALPGPIDQRDLSNLLAAAVVSLGVQRWFQHGASVGGVTALWLAVQHPQRVRALSIEGGMNFVEERHMRNLQQMAVLRQMVQLNSTEGDGYPVSAPHPNKPWATAAYYQGQLRKRIPALHHLTNQHEAQLRERLTDLPCPVMVILGDSDELLLPNHLDVWRGVPRVQTMLLPNAAHDIQNTEPQALVAAMRTHYRSTDRQ